MLAYPTDSAGGIMTPAFVAIAPDLRAAQAIAALQRVSETAETSTYWTMPNTCSACSRCIGSC